MLLNLTYVHALIFPHAVCNCNAVRVHSASMLWKKSLICIDDAQDYAVHRLRPLHNPSPVALCLSLVKAQLTLCRSFFADVPDHSRPPRSVMIVANHQIVALAPDLCLSKTASTILVRQLYDTGTTEVFDPLLVRFPRPLVRPLIRSTRLRARCWRPHPRSRRFATTIKTT